MTQKGKNIIAIPFILLLFIQPFSIQANSKDIFVSATLDTSNILIGDQIRLHLTAEMPLGAAVHFPVLKDSLAGGKIEIIRTDEKDSIATAPNRIQLHRTYIITSFDSGSIEIPPLPFIYGADTIFSLPLLLNVTNMVVKADKPIFDIKDVLRIPLTWKEFLLYLLFFILGGAIVAGVIYVIVRRRANKPLFKMKAPDDPAHVVAFRELEKLKAEKLWQQSKHKEYQSRLTDIIRTYIERRYLIAAMESTSDEIMYEIRQAAIIDGNLSEILEKMLRLADMVKFAKAEPMPDENEDSWNMAYEFVKATLVRPEPVPEPVNVEQPVVGENVKEEAKQ